MASFLTTVALCASVAFAQRPRPSSCPEEIETITTTGTYRGTTTVSDYKTVTDPIETWTRTFDSYNATTTVTEDGTETETLTLTDTTSTRYITTEEIRTYTCDNTITTSQESTRTVYTGSYSSDLAAYCETSTKEIPSFIGGTVTETGTTSVWLPPSYVIKYTPAGTTTVTAYATTVTETETPLEYSSVKVTTTVPTSCTSTVYTATANATATQAAKCAPKNLISNVEYINYRDYTSYSRADDIREGEAAKDASSCCQACEGKELCIASQYSEGDFGHACTNFLAEEGKCPALAMTVQKGKPGFLDQPITISPGCGEVREVFPFPEDDE